MYFFHLWRLYLLRHWLIQLLLIIWLAHIVDESLRLTTTEIGFSVLLSSRWGFELEIWSLVEKDRRLPESLSVTVILVWYYRLGHRLAAYTRAIIELLVIISHNMHGQWFLVQQPTDISAVSPHAWAIPLLSELLDYFDLVFDFQLGLLQHC